MNFLINFYESFCQIMTNFVAKSFLTIVLKVENLYLFQENKTLKKYQKDKKIKRLNRFIFDILLSIQQFDLLF